MSGNSKDIEISPYREIEVVPYKTEWKKDYANEEKKIKNVFKDELINIHHIGSTAIPGICAKPVIDIMVIVKDICKVDMLNNEMLTIGYFSKGKYGIKGRRFFVKGQNNRTHNVHVYQTGHYEILRQLNFRDYLIAHPNEAKNYQNLKKELSEKFKFNIDKYNKGKDSYIKDIINKADQWAKIK
ncbi:GrpB domain, predicted nucleotidyltransferase, UPF0157 family [Clostridium amylolyticum]|uniref:GrpB domain, predicted nucleotidyltransferase, UPF0157 family n=1 Tax=Clostridium amylolyticum TaxID=1121298 RepID=A0A1M6N1J3_9CLOT|nr:GrpB family protein [Clostridium amylolyticum]SHJ89575.1 GrpB domain, predicted nucleotidyltransferase, UPF0157 family [Clostridium amylolyticum]